MLVKLSVVVYTWEKALEVINENPWDRGFTCHA